MTIKTSAPRTDAFFKRSAKAPFCYYTFVILVQVRRKADADTGIFA